MANEVRDLWTEVGNKCLQRASELLDDKTAPAAATAETVRCLVETAISMDMLNLRWAEKTQYGAAVFRDPPLKITPYTLEKIQRHFQEQCKSQEH